jgi:hypothetical protein
MTITKFIQLDLNNLAVVNHPESGSSFLSNNAAQNLQPENSEMILGNGKQIRIKNHMVGLLDNGIFIAERQLKKKFRIHSGWGISKLLLVELDGVHAKKILFKIKDEADLVYSLEVTPRNWLNRGIEYHNPALDEDQLVLPETSFDRKIPVSLKVIR